MHTRTYDPHLSTGMGHGKMPNSTIPTIGPSRPCSATNSSYPPPIPPPISARSALPSLPPRHIALPPPCNPVTPSEDAIFPLATAMVCVSHSSAFSPPPPRALQEILLCQMCNRFPFESEKKGAVFEELYLPAASSLPLPSACCSIHERRLRSPIMRGG